MELIYQQMELIYQQMELIYQKMILNEFISQENGVFKFGVNAFSLSSFIYGSYHRLRSL
jgi:hypothetical protein